MLLCGSVENIIFRNTDTGYTVFDVDVGGKLVTAVGSFPTLAEGESVELKGEYGSSSRFGVQFQADTAKISKPETIVAIQRYLSSDLFAGIGKATAARITDMFGTASLEIIEKSPAKLAQVKGITIKKAMIIGQLVAAQREMQDAVIELQGFGLSVNMSVKIYKQYGKKTKELIEKNPYRLIEDIDGIGFSTADKIAEKIGIEPNSRFRITAGVIYTMQEAAAKNGNTFLPKGNLILDTVRLLGLEGDGAEKAEDVLADLEVMGKIITVPKEEGLVYMLSRHYFAERSIAGHLVGLLAESTDLDTNIEADVAAFESINRIQLHEAQKKAVECTVQNGICVITGGPGTGKTTIIKCVLSILGTHGKKVCLCAPTGRAAKRLAEASGEEAQTVHRLLEMDGAGHFVYNEKNKLECDVIIVDEVSMCDEFIFNSLLKAIKRGGRLIMVGDKDQLPSVGAGNVLADVIASGVIPVAYLTEIYRQGAESLIIANAHRINKGLMPEIDNKSRDFFFSGKQTQQEIADTVREMVTERLPSFAGIASEKIQVLCPMKKGVAGVDNMNILLQEAINPQKGQAEIKVGENIFRAGDKVMHTRNNYQLQWVNEETDEADTGVFNGDIGIIEDINKSAMTITVKFEDGKTAVYGSKDFDQLALAYAISIHKSQGSEFDVVVITVLSGNYMILTRNLLYTAVTRAKKTAVLVGSRDNLGKMVKNNYTTRRFSMLLDFIKEEAQERL